MLALVLAAALAANASAPRVQLMVSPRVAMSAPGRPVVVRALVLIENPGPDWYCPRVAFEWAEGYTSAVESDCAPYDEVSADERRWFRLSRTMPYGAGEHTITVTIGQGAKRRVLTATVLIQ